MRYKYTVFLLPLVCFSFFLTSVLFAQNVEVDLSPREKIWIANHPVLKVANELDWPPFDFAENGEPKGYSVDMVKLAIEKVGAKVEFVNGFSWAELLEKFKAGEIDIMPAIYENEDRHKFTLFTKSYFSQPTVIVVRQDNTQISELTDLYNKKVAVIEDFVITKTLENQHPKIKRIPVQSILDGIKSVSLGKVDAFLESIGVVSYLMEQNYIPNIKLISDYSLKDLDAPKLYMGVAKDRIVLRSILQKGLDAISRDELNEIRQKWISIEIEQPEQIFSLSEWPWFEIVSFSFIFIILVLILRSLIKSRGVISFRNLKISTKIIILLSTVAILAVGVIGFISWNISKKTLEQESFNKLTAVREMKANQIEDYFQQVIDQVITYSEDRMIIEAMKSFKLSFSNLDKETGHSGEVMVAENKQYYETVFKSKLIQNRAGSENSFNEEEYWEGDEQTVILQNLYVTANPNTEGAKHLLRDAGDGSHYSKIHRMYHPIIRNYLEKFGYYDIFLVDHETGHILYSVFKEVDFGTNLFNGPYSNTNIARTFMTSKDAKDKDHFNLVDFEPYMPSYFAPAAFISSPIKDGDVTIGVLIFQMPIDRINSIMTSKKSWSKVGLGKSGETYLVGQDSLLRNQSRFLIEDKENYIKMITDIGLPQETISRIINLNSTIGLQPVITIGTKAALRGETGTQIFPDYRSVSVLSSYKPLNIPDVNWVLMSEIDENEAFANVYNLRRDILFWFFGLIIVIVIIAFIFSKTITRPIEILKNEAEELAKGNLNIEIKAEGKDEIGNLSLSFDIMRRSIKKLVGELEEINNNLEEKVVERTRELEQASEKIKTLVEVAADGIIMIDSEQTILMFNQACESVFGYSSEEIIGKSLIQLLPEKSKSLHQSEIDKFKKEKNKSRMLDNRREIAGRRKDGTIFPAEASISKMIINDDYYFIAFVRDITDRKAIESRLRLQSTALESAANGIVITDPEGFIRWVNPAFSTLTGYSYNEAIGKNPGILKSGQHEDSFYKKMWDTINAKNAWHDEVINKRKDGSFYTEEMTITPVLNEKSELINFVAIKQDVTERKELERKLEEANKRMKDELDIGRDIQMSMLPLIFPAFPDHKEFSVYATLHPAREVGGDFYDFFFIDEDRLCFCIGDVSGKGVPAALFMAVTKTLIKSRSSNDFSTASILTHVNSEMSKDNISSMFVTIFICILDVNSGELIYTNAGHNPAYLKRADGELKRLDTLHGPVIGAVDGLEYKENKLNLSCGDSILLYTDGVTEAMNTEKTLFSENRLVKFISSSRTESVEDLVESLVKEVKKFEGGADQADDITVLAFKYLGKPPGEKSEIFDITIKNGLPAIVQVNKRFNSFADDHGLPKSISRKMNVVFDEILNNIISYAYEDKNEHDIDITVELAGIWLSVKISDDGIPFDPFSVKTPDTDQSLEERDIGGLGIHLVRGMMDKFSYKRENNKNILTFVKHINSEDNSK